MYGHITCWDILYVHAAGKYSEGRVEAIKFQFKQWIIALTWFLARLNLEPQTKSIESEGTVDPITTNEINEF